MQFNRFWEGDNTYRMTKKSADGSKKEILRTLNEPRVFRNAVDGGEVRLPGRAVLFVRNVGVHMFSDACLWKGKEVPEG